MVGKCSGQDGESSSKLVLAVQRELSHSLLARYVPPSIKAEFICRFQSCDSIQYVDRMACSCI